MISRIQGQLVEVNEEICVVMCGGVGYELHCPLGNLADLQADLGSEVLLQVYTHVREDALQLFGFLSFQDKGLFLSLLKVNGIGPKSALNILSGASADQIATMIESEDVKALSQLPKVGKKTAEQMILSLKGKLVRSNEVKAARKSSNRVDQLVRSALVNLGFRVQDVDKLVETLDCENRQLSVEEGIRQGLAALTQI